MSTLLAAASSGQTPGGVEGWLLHFHGPLAYAIVGFLAFAEAGLMVGFFIPGETAVVIGGVLAGLHRVNLVLMIVVVVVCAIVGDSSGFEVGRKAGPWILDRRVLRGRDAISRTVRLLERYGGPAVFMGRFVAFARAIIPGLAGMSGLRYRTFLFYNACGGLLWGVGYTLLGFVVGVSFGRILSTVGLWSLAVVGAIALIAILIKVVLNRREHRRVAAEFSELDDRSEGTRSAEGAEQGGAALGGDPEGGRSGEESA
jgi:membrane protein DedA with SNARE-associated domain